jgi:hypothetical protein
MFNQPGPKDRQPGQIIFHPLNADEYNIPQQFGMGLPANLGVRPKYKDYLCGACSKPNNGRVICDLIRTSDEALVLWCVCSCEKREPTIIMEKDGMATQMPLAREFHAEPSWPSDLARLYEEGVASYCAGAFTAASMVCRKVLMSFACQEGSTEGKHFTEYVDYIIDNLIPIPKAKPAIAAIKKIGNDANHKLQFVTQDDAKRSLQITTFMLHAVYTLSAS